MSDVTDVDQATADAGAGHSTIATVRTCSDRARSSSRPARRTTWARAGFGVSDRPRRSRQGVVSRRAGKGRSRAPLAMPRLLPDDEPLSPPCPHTGARPVGRDAEAQPAPGAANQPATWIRRACLRRSILRRARRGRRALRRAFPLHRSEPGASRPVPSCGAVALERVRGDARASHPYGVLRSDRCPLDLLERHRTRANRVRALAAGLPPTRP